MNRPDLPHVPGDPHELGAALAFVLLLVCWALLLAISGDADTALLSLLTR